MSSKGKGKGGGVVQAAAAGAAAAAAAPTRSITFIKEWGEKSWEVDYDGPYENDRKRHVECVGFVPHAGMQCTLTNLHCFGKAVMWDVEGGSHGAHFTVYFGDNAPQKMLELR